MLEMGHLSMPISAFLEHAAPLFLLVPGLYSRCLLATMYHHILHSQVRTMESSSVFGKRALYIVRISRMIEALHVR